jgi:hypothetical protein
MSLERILSGVTEGRPYHDAPAGGQAHEGGLL